MPQLDDDILIDFMCRCGYLANEEEKEEVTTQELEVFRSFAKLVQVKSSEGFLVWLNKHGTKVQVDLFKTGG